MSASGEGLGNIPPTLTSPAALRFWAAVILTGIGAGIGAGVLTRLLYFLQSRVWPGADLVEAASRAGPFRHIAALAGAGVLTGLGQWLLQRLSSANGIDITEAITRFAGRLPALRTVGSAILSVVVVAMGVSLGREGAPKQVGAVLADGLASRAHLSDEQRRLLVACGAGAGMAAAYGVPLGGAVFALEVLRGVLALRLILPALLAAGIATQVSWLMLPDAPTYVFPAYASGASVLCWAALAGPLIGLVAVGFIRLIAWADGHRPRGWRRLVIPTFSMGLLGCVSIPFPQILGNGKEIAELTFIGAGAPLLLVTLMILKPLATALCLGSGVPGGLFTPSLSTGALLGAVLGIGWTWLWPGVPAGLFAVIGAAAMLAATTHGPISALILLTELTGQDRSFLLPALIAVVTATVVARGLDARSIYEARFSDAEVTRLQEERKPSQR
jgi:H+/Cl- antiporter ClcA